MITRTDLEAAGYKKHPSPRDKFASWLWQKVFRDDSGRRLYFVNIYEHPSRNGCEPTFEPEVQFCGTPTVNVTLLLHGESLADVEAWFRRAFEALPVVAYDDEY